jgi:hypothetical protein
MRLQKEWQHGGYVQELTFRPVQQEQQGKEYHGQGYVHDAHDES